MDCTTIVTVLIVYTNTRPNWTHKVYNIYAQPNPLAALAAVSSGDPSVHTLFSQLLQLLQLSLEGGYFGLLGVDDVTLFLELRPRGVEPSRELE